ncbi:hypothetical protein TNCV_207001 [Trichonephila clavipes]|nr:hypothetical protein TNCV_207001 [Trichonephila clavipes]
MLSKVSGERGSQWARYRIVAHVTQFEPSTIKTRRVVQRCVISVELKRPPRWCVCKDMLGVLNYEWEKLAEETARLNNSMPNNSGGSQRRGYPTTAIKLTLLSSFPI